MNNANIVKKICFKITIFESQFYVKKQIFLAIGESRRGLSLRVIKKSN